MPFGILKLLPQDYAADVYHKVRLGAGTLHLANYLIRVAVYILVAKVWFFFEMAMASYYSSDGGGCPIGVGHDGKGVGHDGSGMCAEHPGRAVAYVEGS